MRLAESAGLKAAVLLVATSGLVWWLEMPTVDSQHTRWPRAHDTDARPAVAGSRSRFTATAYCSGTVTRAGVPPRQGVAAADPALLPLGSIVEVDAGDAMMSGLYSVLDTGPNVKGRRIDLYTKHCADAVRFGRRRVQLSVLRHGWNPQATSAYPGADSRPAAMGAGLP